MATFGGWRPALLRAIRAPVTQRNMHLLGIWAREEGGTARYNPLNTTQESPGSSNYNSVGVKHYASPAAGVRATAQTIKNGHYNTVLRMLRSGNADNNAFGNAVIASPWGTSSWAFGAKQPKAGAPVSTGKQRGRGARGGGGAGGVPAVAPAAPLPRLIPNVTSQPRYAHMAMPTRGVPPGQLLGAPGQAGAVRQYKGYKAALPKLDRQIAQVAHILTPPPVPAAGHPVPSGRPKGGKPAGGAGGKIFNTGWPTGKKGKIIGTPGVGTHNGAPPYDNWQSSHAVDISVPVGTPILAVANGKIGRIDTSNLGNTGSRSGGAAVYLNFPGDVAWYEHLSKVIVKPGQRVKKGQVIGYSGLGANVPHLHFATQHRDPRAYLH